MLFAYEDGFRTSGRIDSITGVLLSVGSAIGAAFYKVDTYVRTHSMYLCM